MKHWSGRRWICSLSPLDHCFAASILFVFCMHDDVLLSEQQEPQKAKKDSKGKASEGNSKSNMFAKKVVSTTVTSATDTTTEKMKIMKHKFLQERFWHRDCHFTRHVGKIAGRETATFQADFTKVGSTVQPGPWASDFSLGFPAEPWASDLAKQPATWMLKSQRPSLPASKSNGPPLLTGVHLPPACGGTINLFFSWRWQCNSPDSWAGRLFSFRSYLLWCWQGGLRWKSVGVQGDGCLTFGPATCQDVVGIRLTVPEDHCRRSNEQEWTKYTIIKTRRRIQKGRQRGMGARERKSQRSEQRQCDRQHVWYQAPFACCKFCQFTTFRTTKKCLFVEVAKLFGVGTGRRKEVGSPVGNTFGTHGEQMGNAEPTKIDFQTWFADIVV